MTHSTDIKPRTATVSDEIVVTPEMIEAGVVELAGFNHEIEGDDDAVRRIFCAMAAVERSR